MKILTLILTIFLLLTATQDGKRSRGAGGVRRPITISVVAFYRLADTTDAIGSNHLTNN